MKNRKLLIPAAEFEETRNLSHNAGLAAARERGVKLGRLRTLHSHHAAVSKLSRRGLSGRTIAAKLNIPVGSVFALMRD